jgi:hypothetical protein
VTGIKGCGAFGRSLRDRLRGSMKRIRWGQAKLIETPGLGPELPIEVCIVYKRVLPGPSRVIARDRP